MTVPTASATIRAGEPVPCRPVPRFLLSSDDWRSLAARLPAEPELSFVALWAEAHHVHALFWSGEPLLASVPVEAGLYAALSPARPGAALFERAVADLWGHQAADALDVRPWLDHGTWPQIRPLSERPSPNAGAPEIPEMREAAGDALGLGPLPPVPAAGPAHWRVGLRGARVMSLEARLGYGHRGLLGLCRGKSPTGAARLLARLDGAATLAHSLAFAHAVEAALELPAPPRAVQLRSAMLAVERVAMALHDVSATAAACARPRPALAAARAALLQACQAAFGHRLMMDAVRPGGVAADPPPSSIPPLLGALQAVPEIAGSWPATGQLELPAAFALNLPGTAGRASGRPDPAAPHRPLRSAGTLAARMELRGLALRADVAEACHALSVLPPGAVAVALPHKDGEGLGGAEGPQGPVWHWVRLSAGTVAANMTADPAALHLPASEQAGCGDPVASLPATVASFGLHLAGLDG